MRCLSFCTASAYRLIPLAEYFKHKRWRIKLTRHVLHVTYPDEKGDVIFFNEGCLVCWGLKRKEEQEILAVVKEFSVHPLEKTEIDFFDFRYGEETDLYPHERFNIDIIQLENDSPQLKLAISYGLAQSIKLESYEESIQKTIDKNAYLPEELALRGKIPLSRYAISKRMGEIFLERSSVNLRGEYFEVPEYFWRHPNLENYYLLTENFLDIPSRVASLNQKLDVLHELFDMLTTQLQNRHSTYLELIIIALIGLEIIISILSRLS